MRAGHVGADLRWYLTGLAAFTFGQGIQGVLFPWLVAFELGETAARVGLAQMSMNLPMLAFVLLGGVIADRFDARRVLIIAQTAGIFPALGLASAVSLELLSYPLMVAYALLFGTVGAFISPARDGILNRVAGRNIQRAVTMATGLGFASQTLGIAVGGAAAQVGAVALLLTHSLMMIVAVNAYTRIARSVPAETRPRMSAAGGLTMLKDGFLVVIRSRELLPVWTLNFSIGVLFAGAFTVGVPLLIRDVYHGTPGELALASMSNLFGTILATLLILARGGIVRRGRGLALALLFGAVWLGSLSLGLPFPLLLVSACLWGMGGGMAIALGRTLIQERLAPEHRSRVMAFYSLAFLGGGPLGALAMGHLVGLLGPRFALLVPAALMVVIVAVVALTTAVWRLGAADE